jgi:hypothetical protein
LTDPATTGQTYDLSLPPGWSFFFETQVAPGDFVNVAYKLSENGIVRPISKRFYDSLTGQSVDLLTDSIVLVISSKYTSYSSVELVVLDQNGNLLRSESIVFFVLIKRLTD